MLGAVTAFGIGRLARPLLVHAGCADKPVPTAVGVSFLKSRRISLTRKSPATGSRFFFATTVGSQTIFDRSRNVSPPAMRDGALFVSVPSNDHTKRLNRIGGTLVIRDFLSFLVTGEPFSDRELAQVRREISFSEAISAHLEWKRRFSLALAGGGVNMPVCEHVATDTLCDLGKWIHGMGQKRYGELRNFVDLREEHIRFHRVAGQVVALYRGSRSDEAKALLNGEFRRSSNEIISRLKRLSTLFGC